MSRLRSIALLAALAALVVLVLAAAGPSSADGDLEGRIAALHDRVAGLEAEIEGLETRIRSNHPDPEMERAAVAELQQINRLVAGGAAGEAKERLDAFMAEYANTRAGAQARGLQQEIAVVGRDAPAQWAIPLWFQGEADVDLHADNPTVLVFWETWCPHCRREVPKLQKLYDDHAADGLQIVGFSKLTRGATEETVRAFIDEHDLSFPMARENGGLSGHFGVSGIPAVAVMKDQRVVWRGHPARLTSDLIDSWLQ